MARKSTKTTPKGQEMSESTMTERGPDGSQEDGAELLEAGHGGASEEKGFPIVGIGASAGGLSALESFFTAMPSDSEPGIAFVVVQHLSPDHKSILGELLSQYTAMRVFEAEDGMRVAPNCVYTIPPSYDIALLGGALQLLTPPSRELRLPIDFFFRSLAQDKRERAIGIVLSGTGSDGSLGLRAIKGEGGMTMAQDPDTIEFDGMPRSAIATGVVDYVLSAEEMPAQLLGYINHIVGGVRAVNPPASAKSEDILRKICVVLRSQTGHDFSQYKHSTLMRRIERRMAIHQITRISEYLRYLQGDRGEAELLFRDLLIGVTSFFRDRDAFQVLEKSVIPRLFANRTPGSTVRIWVCGCSTGEEAYSIAILIQEYIESIRQSYKVQIFATDLDKQAIEQARSGVFPASIAMDVSSERLSRYFSREPGEDVYRIQKVIRDLLIFSEQDVIKDPPFSRLDLISCRNLMIYMNAELQKKLIPLFHYALNADGILFLGTAETTGEYASLFSAIDRKWRIYQRQQDFPSAAPLFVNTMAGRMPPVADRPAAIHVDAGRDARTGLRLLTEQALLSHYAQVGILVNGRGDILYIMGRTGKYLEPAPGDAGVNILPMAREGLRRELTTALHRAVTHKAPVSISGLNVRTNGDFVTADLTVRPVVAMLDDTPTTDLYLVILEEKEPPDVSERGDDKHGPEKGGSPSEADTRIAALEQELRAKEEFLQSTLEEMETSNEELKSTNEELQSVNEELQSTNEELETSKEELQSVNEELATVNAELQVKVAALSRSNNDLNNLLAGTGVGTLFVDHYLNISRFTPAITQVINLIQSDVGRPVGHIVSNLVGYSALVEDVQSVLDTLIPVEAEVQTKSGAWYLMRIRPYRTLDNVIEGVVLTFVDVTQRKKAEMALSEAKAKLDSLAADKNRQQSNME